MSSPKAAFTTGGPPGNLYVIVRTKPDSRFQRLGADLWRTERLEVADAVLGVHRRVPTIDGEVEVTIPGGTQPEEVLRLRGTESKLNRWLSTIICRCASKKNN